MVTILDVMSMTERKDVDGLIQALRDRDVAVRAEVASTLGRLGDRKAVEPLISMLQDDSDPYVRSLSATALGELGDSRAMEPLQYAIKNDTIEVSAEAGRAARLLGLKTPLEVKDRLTDERTGGKVGVRRGTPTDKTAESTNLNLRERLWRGIYWIGLLMLIPGLMIAAMTIYGLTSPDVVVEDLPMLLTCSGSLIGLGLLLMYVSSRRREEEQPTGPGKTLKAPQVPDGVRFLRKYTKTIIAGMEGTYMDYEADSLGEARKFLVSQDVTFPRFYIEVHTPEGGVGKDIKGTYEFDV